MEDKTIQYFDGELTGPELAAFEKSVSNDPSLQADIENLQLSKDAIRHYGLKTQVAAMHKNMMAELRSEQTLPKRKIYPFGRPILRIAASLLLFMFLFTAYEFVTVSPSGIVSGQPYELSIERGASVMSPLEQAYADHNYNEVIQLLSKSSSPTVKEQFIAGQAWLALYKPSNAVDQFKKVLGTPGATYRDDAEYYLAISYLQNNDPVDAKKYFSKIHDDKDHLYNSQVSSWTLVKLNLLILKNKL